MMHGSLVYGDRGEFDLCRICGTLIGLGKSYCNAHKRAGHAAKAGAARVVALHRQREADVVFAEFEATLRRQVTRAVREARG